MTPPPRRFCRLLGVLGQVTDAQRPPHRENPDLTSRHDVVRAARENHGRGARFHRPRLADNDGGPVAALSG